MNRARALVLAALVPLVLAGLARGKDEPAAKPEKKLVIKFKADKMVLGSDLKTATLTGHVKVTVADVSITCKKLDLSYGGGKKVASFKAKGDVVLVMGDLTATAKQLDYDASTRIAQLDGSCQVKTASVKLSGESISIELDTRKISIQKASGTIDIGNQTF